MLFLYPNTYGMNMLPPAIALFAALLKKKMVIGVKFFDTTYYNLDHGIDSDGSKMERLNVVPYRMDEKGIKQKTSDWKKDLNDQVNKFKPKPNSDLFNGGYVGTWNESFKRIKILQRKK